MNPMATTKLQRNPLRGKLRGRVLAQWDMSLELILQRTIWLFRLGGLLVEVLVIPFLAPGPPMFGNSSLGSCGP